MAILKCKMCGGNLEVQEGMTICECEYCGSTQTVPALDNEKKITLFTRANRLRSVCEFDKASGIYESIVAEFPEEAEAYWGLILCKYGIEYVDDPKTGKKIPTCHRSSFDNLMDDENFDLVMEYSEPSSRSVYREEAKVIEGLRMGIIEVSSKEEPYDIFICYKETDLMGERTIDSVIAQDVYDVLTEKGYKVFFSRITLEDKLGQEYEPYIFAALNSAKIMLAFGTDYEYYNAVWVKNEWSRFLSLIEKGEKKTLIPCYKGIDAYDMPREFARLQAQDMGKVGAIQDLVRGIGKILGTTSPQFGNISGVASAEGSVLVQRGNMALEDEDFKGAEGYFERALDTNPSDAYAYLGKFLAFYGLKSLNDLEDKVCAIDASKEFRRAEQFADAKLANELKKVKEFNSVKIERLRLIDALKKYRKKSAVLELDNMKKTAYGHLMTATTSGETKAREIYANLLSADIISKNEYSNLIERIYIVKAFATVLGDYEMHSSSRISTEYPLNKYMRPSVSLVLRELIKFGYVEEHALGYCLTGAKEEKARLLKEAEELRIKEERQKAAYEAACVEVEEQIQRKVAPIISLISSEYDSKIQGIQKELQEAIGETNRQRAQIQSNINELYTKQSSLGLFKGKEKRALQVQIDELQKKLAEVISDKQLQLEYQPLIDRISKEKKHTIDKAVAEVRSKHTKPKYEDFVEI